MSATIREPQEFTPSARLSVSIGVADYPEGGQTIEDLLRTADRDLYEIKNEVGKALQ